ncbi:hypothetical protein NC653_034285 [Populus alba x Populus x berolinensis]|uniref:Uncharacterized protein n=1 Tax=Populus alba x Populus x berolinensis TaxID=444605 RepID=A0AAD6PW03_9ROSI|nr:hypothetical protein NC653_034285 [Populus alba x Populus x berolinensis]
MQRQYTSNLIASEALEARWYCSILNFQLYLAVILLFHLFWEFFEGKMVQLSSIGEYFLFNLSSFALLFLCICGFSSTASPPSLDLRSRFSIHLLLFVNQICGRENKHKVVERMMMVLQMASESVIFTQ